LGGIFGESCLLIRPARHFFFNNKAGKRMNVKTVGRENKEGYGESYWEESKEWE